MNADRNKILARRNKGSILIKKLSDGIYDLNMGDRYVHMKGNRVLNWESKYSNDAEIGLVLWEYNVRFAERIICDCDEPLYNFIKIKRNHKVIKF